MSADLDNLSNEQDDLAKQTLVRVISLELIEQLEPSQLEASDLVIDDLIDLAEQGRILPRGAESAFGFGGLDLIAQYIVPAVIAALTTLVLRQSSAKTQTEHHQTSDRVFLTDQQLEEIVQRAGFTITSRQGKQITRLINIQINRYLDSGGAAIYRPTPEDIDDQQKRLELHRQHLLFYLNQKAIVGTPYITPASNYSIREAYAEIKRAKDILRSWGIVVDDHPDDEPV